MKRSNFLVFILFLFSVNTLQADQGLPLYYWQQKQFINFGDYISLKLVERITDSQIEIFYRYPKNTKQKLLAIGSILSFAVQNDVIWGTGVNGKWLGLENYPFTNLDARSVRGPLTRKFLMDNFGIGCPEIYGDPALLFPYFFPEFQRSENPSRDYIVIPHYTEKNLFPKDQEDRIVYPTDPWDEVIGKIIDSQLVISSSLHGIVIAEAYGIPAICLRATGNEPLFKYEDYYQGTGRPDFKYATTVEEALKMGGERPFECDLNLLYESFPREFWPYSDFKPLVRQ
ncbi:MAG TPA: polysaccharide pyruvyl transferase family protein [Parachlamydiaceae bacterium]|nr:polysaccharide pyruvyl transferase family protein [Parachlamydiaceae bacterium]